LLNREDESDAKERKENLLAKPGAIAPWRLSIKAVPKFNTLELKI
jgi:hypothetical protein